MDCQVHWLPQLRYLLCYENLFGTWVDSASELFFRYVLFLKLCEIIMYFPCFKPPDKSIRLKLGKTQCCDLMHTVCSSNMWCTQKRICSAHCYYLRFSQSVRPPRSTYQTPKCTPSQGGEGTKVHVFLSCQGAISFYAYIVPSGLISIYLGVECDKISCGLKPADFFWIFYTTTLTKKVKFQIYLLEKSFVIQKDDKKTMYNTLLWLLWFLMFLLSYEHLKPYFQTSAQEISANLGHCPVFKHR